MTSVCAFHLFYVFSIVQVAYQTTYPCDSKAPCGCSEYPVTAYARIVNGEDAGYNTLSWAVSLQLGDYLCGGSIIHESFVVTAAHCVDHDFSPLDITVYAGSLMVDEGITKRVSRFYSHPNYDKVQHTNDIALLQLASPLDLSNVNLAKICLPSDISTPGEYPPENTPLITAGWGRLSFSGPDSPKLQQVTIQAVGAETPYCQNITTNTTVELCAGIMPQGGKGKHLLL